MSRQGIITSSYHLPLNLYKPFFVVKSSMLCGCTLLDLLLNWIECNGRWRGEVPIKQGVVFMLIPSLALQATVAEVVPLFVDRCQSRLT